MTEEERVGELEHLLRNFRIMASDGITAEGDLIKGYAIDTSLLGGGVGGIIGVTGACCFPDGSCTPSTETACEGAGGVYQGDGTTCSPNPCPGGELPPCNGCDGFTHDLLPGRHFLRLDYYGSYDLVFLDNCTVPPKPEGWPCDNEFHCIASGAFGTYDTGTCNLSMVSGTTVTSFVQWQCQGGICVNVGPDPDQFGTYDIFDTDFCSFPHGGSITYTVAGTVVTGEFHIVGSEGGAATEDFYVYLAFSEECTP